MFTTTDPQALLIRRDKFRRKASRVADQHHLDRILRSFPKAIRRDVYDEVKPLLRFPSSYPENLVE